MKYIVCYSGGHSSALVAVEAVRRYSKENVILLNHDISSHVEDTDVKRFKNEVAAYLDIPITYANAEHFEKMPPLEVAKMLGGFQFRAGKALCTKKLKTEPFFKWLDENCAANKENFCILYGFDADEENRISRRSILMRAIGYKTDFPLAYWQSTITEIEEIGIKRPDTYKFFKHANCCGCLKAGKQHWYAVYCLRRDIFNEALEAENEIGYSIIKGAFLRDLEPIYKDMLENKKICPNDKEHPNTFWARVEQTMPEQLTLFPCDCAF